jgi:hypothetical protein
MSQRVYPKALEGFASAAIDLTSVTVKFVAVASSYTYSAAHQFLSDLGATTVSTTLALASKTVTNGVFSAADSSIPNPSGAFTQLVSYVDTGTAGTSRLLSQHDVSTTTPNGNAIALPFPAGVVFNL